MMKRVFLTVLSLVLVLSMMAVAVPGAKAADTVIATGTVTATGGLNVRSGAGVNCAWVNRLSYGTRVEIYEKKTVGTSDWGRINATQWVCLDYIKFDSTTQASGTPIDKGTVKVTGGLNVRSGAGVSYTWLTRLANGTRVDIYEKKRVGTSDWGRINATQWVCLDYVVLDSASSGNTGSGNTASGGTQTGETAIATGTVTADGGVNIRSGAGVNYALQGKLANGTRVSIYEKKRAGTSDWGRFNASQWICLDYVKLDGSTNSGTTQASDAAIAKGVITVNGAVNVRSGAGVGYALVDQLPNGTSVSIYEKKTVGTADWGRIGTNRWVCMDYVKLDTTTSSGTTVTSKTGTVKVTGTLNVRSGAGVNYALVGSLTNGTKVTVTEEKTVNGVKWGKISNGWICLDYVVWDTTSGNETPKEETKPEEKPAAPVENGWSLENGVWYYYKDGKRVTGWLTLGGKRYYLQESGAMVVGYLDIEGKMYYFGSDGACDEKMHFSSNAITVLKQWEGFSATPYWDYAQYTVGYGTRCPDDKLEEYRKNGITREEAEVLLRNHLYSDESAVTRFMESKGLKFNQGQFDALVSLSYNCGTGWTTSTTGYLYKALTSGATGNDLLYAMGLWSTAGGEVLAILVNRRLAEANMYLNGQYSRTQPANYRYVYLDGNGGKVTNRVHSFDSNTKVNIFEKPTYGGYTFTGWYTASSGGQKVETLSSDITTGTRLYAHWVDANGNPPGTGSVGGTVIATGTVTASGGLNVRSGAGTGYSLVTNLPNGTRVEIYEKKTVGSSEWGRVSKGWICLDYVKLDDSTGSTGGNTGSGTTTGTTKTGTVNVTTTLTVRSGPGTNYGVVGSLTNGTKVTITEIKTADGVDWGKISSGWICMTYVVLD